MVTLHMENTVQDFDAWKQNFDKFDRFRADNGVRSYRVARQVEDGNRLTVDLEFDDVASAAAFRGALEKIWSTPQSKEQLVSHSPAVIYETADQREVSAAAASAS